MEANFWHDRWAKNEIGWHERDFHPLLTAHFSKLSLPPGSRVFVPLCGKTRDIAWLLQKGYRVAGAELSEVAVQQLFDELAVKPVVSELGKFKRYQAPSLDVLVGDVFALGWAELGPVNAVYDRAALVALPAEMRNKYTRHLRSLTNTAPQLLICFDYDQAKLDGPPFSVNRAEVERQYGEAYQLTLAESRLVPGGLKGLSAAEEVVWLLSPLS